MDSFEVEKKKLISHIKNQQSILLFASQLSKQIEVKEIFKIIEKVLVKTVGVSSFSLHIESLSGEYEMVHSFEVSREKKATLDENDFFFQTLSKSGITIYAKGSNFDELGAGIEIFGNNENFQPEVAIAIRDSKKVIGIICIFAFKNKRFIQDEDIQFFSMLSSQVAPSLEAAKLHQVKMDNLKSELLEKEAKNLKVVNDKLEKSNKDLIKANDKLNDFVAMVAHDLRNPIGAIQSYSVLLNKSLQSKEVNLTEREDKMLGRIKDLCDLSIGLIHDILELAALGSGKLEINKENVQIQTVLEVAFENVTFFAQKKSIKMINEIKGTSTVCIDRERIIQVVTNLLTNSIKFTPKKGEVKLCLTEKDGMALVEVIDNGVGIPEKMVEKLFNKESVTSTSGTEGEKGTGFGLPLCQDLIKAHESEIKIESFLEKGSRFYFELPIIKES